MSTGYAPVQEMGMFVAYCLLAIFQSLMLMISGITKLQHHPRAVDIIHDRLGVPLEYFAFLAACEFAGALGLLAGIWRRRLGIVAAVGVVIYFIGAIISHLRVSDYAGIGSAAFMLVIALALLAIRIRIKVDHPPKGA